MGKPGRDLHRGAPGEERGRAGGRPERAGEVRRAGPKRRQSRAAAPSQGHGPSCLGSLLCRRVQSGPLPAPSVPQCGAPAAMTAWQHREEGGGVHPGLLAEVAARPQARGAHACSVLARAEASRTRMRTRDDPLYSGGDGGFSRRRLGPVSVRGPRLQDGRTWVRAAGLPGGLRPRRRAGPARRTEPEPGARSAGASPPQPGGGSQRRRPGARADGSPLSGAPGT